MKFIKIVCVLLLTSLFTKIYAQQGVLKAGVWRGTFTLYAGQESPFNFEVKGKNVYLLNASERFELKNFSIKGDSLFIPIDVFDAVLAAKIEPSGDKLTGFLKKNASVTPIPFQASFGKRYRFFEQATPVESSLAGKWEVLVGTATTPIIGVFEQKNSGVTGTFLSKTGDYRFLEGNVKGKDFYLSAFSGSSPSLIKGRIEGDVIEGEMISASGTRPFKGKKNDQAELPDAYSLTKVKENKVFSFAFPDAFTGQTVTLQDAKYKGKVVVVTILGSWCPNCIDEASFLAPWYKTNAKRGVELVGLSFERKNDPEFAKTRLQALKNRFGIEYDLLFAGLADTKYASSVLPGLTDIVSFPTTIFINKKGEVAKIHTGYSGPATGKYYDAFVKEFNNEINTLLKD